VEDNSKSISVFDKSVDSVAYLKLCI